jgi:hypothetical protein
VRQIKRTKLHHTSISAAHLSFVMNSNDHLHHLVGDPCQTVSTNATGQRDCTTFNSIHATGYIILRNNSIRQGNKLGLPICRRDLPNIRRFHMGIY